MSTMNPTPLRLGIPFAGLAALLTVAALGADDKTQTVDGQGISFQAPAAWKQEAPQSEMRRAQLKIEPAKGDEHPAELILFAFPGGAGTVDANVERWQRMFRDKDGNPPKVDVKTVKGQNVDVSRVEIAGHYTPMTFPGQEKQKERENHRLLGAIAITPRTGYFLRLVGPDKTIVAARPDFDKLIASLKVDEK
jgi:hypothetical protein